MSIIETFEHLSFEDLRGYIAAGKKNTYLELKTVKNASFESTDDKRNLARALGVR